MLEIILRLNSDFVMLFIRLVLGSVMIYYGLPKIRNLKSNAEDFTGMGLKPGLLWGTLVAVVEFLGGFAVLLGIFAELAAILFGVEMIVGIVWKITKAKKPFTDWSYDLQLLALSLTLVTFGPGIYSLLQLY